MPRSKKRAGRETVHARKECVVTARQHSGDGRLTQSYYIRRKVSTKQPPLKAKEVQKLVHDAVSVLSTIVSYQSYVEHKGRMVATLINLFEEVPAVTTENISFDKGGMKRKKT